MFKQGHLRVPRAARARLPLRAHLCICMFLHRGRFWLLNYFPEEECLVYWSPSKSMEIWRSGGLPPEKFYRTTLSAMPGNAPSEDRRNGKNLV